MEVAVVEEEAVVEEASEEEEVVDVDSEVGFLSSYNVLVIFPDVTHGLFIMSELCCSFVFL